MPPSLLSARLNNEAKYKRKVDCPTLLYKKNNKSTTTGCFNKNCFKPKVVDRYFFISQH
uniref:Uncharacterized protein n=1 Tax=Anguilla anguilla TaxID=7936 RepID=A0A0E9TZ76_ANGAN